MQKKLPRKKTESNLIRINGHSVMNMKKIERKCLRSILAEKSLLGIRIKVFESKLGKKVNENYGHYLTTLF